MYKLWDFGCPTCGHMQEHLVEDGEVVHCPFDGETPMARYPFVQGTAARAQVNPGKTREMFGKAKEMWNKVHGKTPWRRSSHSQTGNE